MKQRTYARYYYPWRSGNKTQLLVDGEHFFPAMLEAVRQARQCIYLEMYLIESSRILSEFIDVLLAANKRGVEIRLLFDDFGSKGIHKQDLLRLLIPGIHIQFYNPMRVVSVRQMLFRDHRKILIVDHQMAFVGGAGLTDEFVAEFGDHSRAWHDVMLRVEGPCVRDWVKLFDYTWRGQNDRAEKEVIELPQAHPQGVTGRVVCNLHLHHKEITRSVYKRMRQAERSIWMSTAYFVPSVRLRYLLIRAARRGVDVRLLLPGKISDHPPIVHAGRRFYTRLLKAGVKIYEYQPRFNHLKMVMCDHWVAIGSSNIDRWNLRWNLEANQEIEDERFVQQVQNVLENDFQQSLLIDLKQWRRRSWRQKLQERFWGVMDNWLERLSLLGMPSRRLNKSKRSDDII